MAWHVCIKYQFNMITAKSKSKIKINQGICLPNLIIKASDLILLDMKKRMTWLLPLLSPLLSLSNPQVPLPSALQNPFGAHGRSSTRLTDIICNHAGMSSNRNPVYGFRTFCIAGDLAAKKCVPCNSKDLRPMTEESANEITSKVAGWNLVNENGILKLNRSWKVKSFTKGLDLFQLVGNVAEAEGHHPDLHLVGWNNIKIEIWTHAVGGLTENDFILAAKINELDLHHLLRKKVAA